MANNRMELNFLLNSQEPVEVGTEATQYSARLLSIRPRPATIYSYNTQKQEPQSPQMGCRYDVDTYQTRSPSSSASEWSMTEYGSRCPSNVCIPPLRVDYPGPEEHQVMFTGVPHLQYQQWPVQEVNTNYHYLSHCRQCCQTLSDCMCHRQGESHNLTTYNLKSEHIENENRLQMAATRQEDSRSPRRHRHDPYHRRHSEPSVQLGPESKMLPPGRLKYRRTRERTTPREPHSNKKYPREQVQWMSYMKEDCNAKYETIVENWWKTWPGSRSRISHQSISSRLYRDNLMPLFDELGSIIRDTNGKIIMASCKVRERSTKPEHKEFPFTFVEKLPHRALDPNLKFKVSEEHKELARNIIKKDEANPNSIPAKCRCALAEFEAAIDPPGSDSTSKSQCNVNKLAEAAGYVVLMELKPISASCNCGTGRKQKDKSQEAMHEDWCPIAWHHAQALLLCECKKEVRERTKLHLPYCPCLKYELSGDLMM